MLGMGYAIEQQMRATPALIALNNMLILNTQELQQLVQQELAENPALDQNDTAELHCEICGRTLQIGVCYACLSIDHELWAAERTLKSQSTGESDPLLQIASPRTLIAALETELRTAVDHIDAPIATFIIGSLDQRGMLASSVEVIAAQLHVPLYRVERVLQVLQEIAPPGVGARCIRECLLLQIDRLETRDALYKLMRCIVAEHWEDFVAHRFTSLARTIGIPYEQLLAVRDLIRRELQPYPLAEQDADARPGTLYPDVMITTEGDLFSVEVAEGRHYSLRLNPLYQQLSHAVRREEVAMSEADREHLHLHVARAQLFLRNLLQRRRTIHAIAAYVVEQQTAFLRQGIRHLQPLTRTEVGEALGLHDSTVSRATAHKYVLLPSREIIPFSTFFSASLSVKDVLKELINSEKRPLTDDEIADQLRHRGYALARRTVAKYRGQLGIPPAAVR